VYLSIGCKRNRRLLGRCYIGPPGPGRYTHETGELQHAIGRTPWIATYHQQARLTVDGGCHVLEGFPFSDNVFVAYFLLFQQVTETLFLVGYANDDGATLHRCSPSEGLVTDKVGVLGQQIDGCLYHWVFTLVNHHSRGVVNNQVKGSQCVDRLRLE